MPPDGSIPVGVSLSSEGISRPLGILGLELQVICMQQILISALQEGLRVLEKYSYHWAHSRKQTWICTASLRTGRVERMARHGRGSRSSESKYG